MHFSTWNIDASQILSRHELSAVLKDLKRRAARLPNVQMNLAIVRLACCCGLRASEIGGLRLGDVRVGSPASVPAERHSARTVELRVLGADMQMLTDLTVRSEPDTIRASKTEL